MCRCRCTCDPAHPKKGHMREHRYGYRRKFLTKAEEIEKLEKYAEELRKEQEAVEEHIKEIQN
jgi:hypothetical protein